MGRPGCAEVFLPPLGRGRPGCAELFFLFGRCFEVFGGVGALGRLVPGSAFWGLGRLELWFALGALDACPPYALM